MFKKAVVLVLILSLFLTACNLYTGATVTDPDDPCFDQENKDICYSDNLKCSKITNENIRDSCVAELAKLKNDLQVCNLIASAKTKAYCQQQIALQTDDFSLCPTIEDEYWKDNCYFQLATKHNEKDYCSEILRGEQQLECIEEIAYATNNLELCQRLENVKSQKCIFSIAKTTKNPETCLLLTTKLNQDACRYKVAKLLEDDSLCADIYYDQIREDCYNFFQE